MVADGDTLFRSGVMKAGDAARRVDVDLTGKQVLLLVVRDGRDNVNYDHANWADALFEVTGRRAGRHRRASGAGRAEGYSDAQARPPTADQRSSALWRAAGATIYLSYSLHRHAAARSSLHKGCPRGWNWMPQSGVIRGRVPGEPGDYLLTTARDATSRARARRT